MKHAVIAMAASCKKSEGLVYGEGVESLPRGKVTDRSRHNDLRNRIVHVLGVPTVWLERDRRLCAAN
jgi:hypothetical protein